jgi:catechol 2,3-dioxygenase-like lactoylglutathione lyase family enzyme
MITALNHITLAVTDIDRSFDFYRKILGLTPLVKWDRGAYFLLPDGIWFCLNVDNSRAPNPCYTHYAFSVAPNDFQMMSQKLLHSQVQTFKDNTSPGDSLYFLDPDGHKLEIHASNWRERIEAKKADPGIWAQVIWYV